MVIFPDKVVSYDGFGLTVRSLVYDSGMYLANGISSHIMTHLMVRRSDGFVVTQYACSFILECARTIVMKIRR